MRFPLLPAAAALCLLPSCVTEQSSAPPNLADAVVSTLTPQTSWTVEESGEQVGSMVLFEEVGPAARTLFVVRNEHGQDVGRLDGKGRAYRLRPHQEPEWLGTGTMVEGVRMLLDRPQATLVRMPGGEPAPPEARPDPAGSGS